MPAITIRTTFLVVAIWVLTARGFTVSRLSSSGTHAASHTLPATVESNAEDATSPSTEVKPSTPQVPDPSIILKPYLPATDPNYRNSGPIGEGTFVIERTGEPRAEELANENILKVVTINCTDLEVNTLVWKCLGYRFTDGKWNNEKVFPKWKDRFPEPPDLIGMQRVYEKEIDQPSLKSNQALVRSVPVHAKQSLKTNLKPLGFRGYKYAELTPNKTRRAQCANWLLFYREDLFGKSIEELKEQRRKREEAEAAAADGEWKPPVKEVF